MEENSENRTLLARIAAWRMLFGRRGTTDANRVSSYGSIESGSLLSAASPATEDSECHRCRCLRVMGAARRMFSLLVTFDLILAFLLWGIYVKTKDTTKSLSENFVDEVVHYHINTSLFDTFVCGVFRFIPLTFAYSIFRIKNPSVIAVTSFVTCLFIITKIFLFKFGDAVNALCIVILVEQFVIAWVETWLLDCRVLPQELADISSENRTEREQLPVTHELDSPFHTPEEGSEDGYEESSYEDNQYRTKAIENWNRVKLFCKLADGWKMESVSTDDIRVFGRQIEKLGKLLRVEAYIDASPTEVFHLTTEEYENTPRWNKTVIDCRILQTLGDNTDVTYNVTAEAGAGLVSSRDFVTVRHWKHLDNGDILSAACAAEHARRPPDPRYVRGENRLSAFLYRTVPNSPNSCLLVMFVSMDIKGWFPQVVVDKTLAGVLVDFVHCLRRAHASRELRV